MKGLKKFTYAILVAIIVFTTISFPTVAQEPPFPNCRLGVGGADGPDVSDYNIGQLNMGMYLEWWTRNDPFSEKGVPTNVEYINVVRVHQDKVGGKWNGAYVNPPTYTLEIPLNNIVSYAANRPGGIWFIGNEIDRRDWSGGGQDEMTPELYATAFHDVRAVIKAADPTARIGIASVIQPTPLRLKYLDRVWDSYFNQYGYSMGQDIDIWNVHGFILREVRGEWGAEIPPGFDNTDSDPTNDYDPEEGFLHDTGPFDSILAIEHHNIERFKEFTVALRAWMAAHGERHKPLINTEYGILFDERGGYTITDQRMQDYLTASFDYMLTATDETIGYPADGNKLVQGWVWYSLNDDFSGLTGNLFDSNNKTLTGLGTAWKNYVTSAANPLASQPQQDLIVSNLRVEPEYYIEPAAPVTFTLRADISNGGNSPTDTGNNIQVSFWDGPPNQSGSNQIGSDQVIDLPGCGLLIETAQVAWPNRTSPTNEWYVKVEPIADETNTSDNVANYTVYIFDPLPTAELALVKSVDNKTPTEFFDEFNYTIEVTNPGSGVAPGPANDLVIKDKLPAGLIFDSYEASQGSYFTSGSWLVGNLAENTTATLSITARVAKGYGGLTITNTATISDNNNFIDTQADNNISGVSITSSPLSEVYLPLVLK